MKSITLIAESELAPLVNRIDNEALYPGDLLHQFGEAGAFQLWSRGNHPDPNLKWAIDCMAEAGRHCLSTAFCMWCQNALSWYLSTSDNEQIQDPLGKAVSSGLTLGGTALSNPMKHFFGIEPLKLHGKRVTGGYQVSGSLPWVSNLGDDHYFGLVFKLEEKPEHTVMAIVSCNSPGLSLNDGNKFVALNGTGTFSVRMENVFIPERHVLADPAKPYIKKIRAGFILLQAGMAVGLISDCINSMIQMRSTHRDINRYLPDQPEMFEEKLENLNQQLKVLTKSPFETSDDYFREVLSTRLALSELSLSTAIANMAHEGARGYLRSGHGQRRLRESIFVAIVTPATKQLHKMLSELNGHQISL